jgi:hypothetical protein
LARHKFAVIALAAVALCSSFWLLLDVIGAVSHRQVFGVEAFESRFDDLRQIVQPNSVYGYLSDQAANDASARPEFFLTEYTLAPVIVKDTPNEPLVIANFHNTKPDQKLLRANNLVLMRDFGNGILLCRRRR